MISPDLALTGGYRSRFLHMKRSKTERKRKMKIDLGNNQSLDIHVEYNSRSSITVTHIDVTGKKTNSYLDLIQAVATHAALGELIKELRKKLS